MAEVDRIATGAASIKDGPPLPLPVGRSQDGLTVRVWPESDRRLRVLVADDDADTADSLALLLRLWGHEVWVAYGGAEAIATAFVHHPNVMLLDVAMPDLDGFCVARAVRHQPFLDGAVLVAVTGYGDDAHRQLGAKAGFDHYLLKPVAPSAIQALLLQFAGDGPRRQRRARTRRGVESRGGIAGGAFASLAKL